MKTRYRLAHKFIAIVCLGILCDSPAVQARYGGGSGTENDPYQIYTAEHLNQIGVNESDLDEHFLLMADINLSAYQKREFNIIGQSEEHPFEGVFDGNGFRILNFSYKASQQDYVGLFGIVGEPQGDDAGEIRDLGLVDVNVDGGEGISTGGLMGFLARGRVVNCYVRSGTVRNHSYFVGGLAGACWGQILSSYADVRVSGVYQVGGLVGLLGETAAMTNVYARGRVSGTKYVGGLVGDMRQGALAENGYATGRVAGELEYAGLVGINDGEIINCFWDYQSSKNMYMCGGGGEGTGCTGDGGKTTAEMQREDTFDDTGWDFDTPIWKIKEDREPPRLWWEISNPVTFCFTLDGEQVIGTVDTTANGVGVVRFDQENSEIRWDIMYEQLNGDPNTEITSVSLRGPAEPNELGDIQIDLLANSVSAEELASTAPIPLTEQQAEDLLSGLWYVEITTVRNPAGQIRGQVVKENDIQVNSIKIKAGKSRTEPADSVKVAGSLYLSTDDAAVEDLIYGQWMDICLVNINQDAEELDTIFVDVLAVDVDPDTIARKGTFSYKRSKNGSGAVKNLKIDFNKNTFTIDAKPTDLSGLRSPFKITIAFGPYRGAVLAEETNAEKVNKGKPLPICLLADQEDTLRVDKAKVKSKKKGDSLSVQGAISAGDPMLDLSQETVTVVWGDFQETLSQGDLEVKKGRKYYYKKPKNGPGAISTLSINLDKCTFKLSIKEAPELAKEGTVPFEIVSENFQAENEVEL